MAFVKHALNYNMSLGYNIYITECPTFVIVLLRVVLVVYNCRCRDKGSVSSFYI